MKKLLIKGGLVALSLCLGLPVGNAMAQDFSSVYVTPRLIYSIQNGDMNSTRWDGGGSYYNSILNKDVNSKRFGVGISAGLDFEYIYALPLRVELEYAYHGKGKFDSGWKRNFYGTNDYNAKQVFNVKAHTFMVNAFYDIKTNSPVSPYVGGGLGMSFLDSKYRTDINLNGTRAMVTQTTRDNQFAWNLGGGLAYQINDIVAVDVGYRYYDFGKVDFSRFDIGHVSYSGKPSLDMTAHEFSVGLRFSSF